MGAATLWTYRAACGDERLPRSNRSVAERTGRSVGGVTDRPSIKFDILVPNQDGTYAVHWPADPNRRTAPHALTHRPTGTAVGGMGSA